MTMISQKRKRPLVSTRIRPLPSQSRSTSVIRDVPPTFRQERNRPDILRQTYLSHTQSHSMGGATRSDMLLSVNGSIPNLSDEIPMCGACGLVKTNHIVRISQEKIKVVIDPVHRRATGKVVHSLLAQDMGLPNEHDLLEKNV
ncbi:hypothetical protein C1H46_007112 [Malus baccata]|uniref:Uncharacterized protein n=1 Tax=Malus baccata TaxID=106549 RepID=A0A540N9X7_MALBA|nr:hypothetical protein C1H46_007112 [Malus baccata]